MRVRTGPTGLLLLALHVTSARGLAGQGSPGAPEGPATRRAREVVALINTGTPDRIRAFVDSSFTAGAVAAVGAERITAFFFEQRAQSGRLRWIASREPRRGVAAARVSRTLSNAVKDIVVAIDSAPPYRIDGYGVRPPPSEAIDTPRRVRSDREIASDLAQYVRRLADADQFSGTVLVTHHGRTIFRGAYGAQSKEYQRPNQMGTRFNIGSMSKMFTAVAIAQLVDAGQLSFEDRLTKYLPDMPTPRDAEQITIAHLLSHTSGLGEIFTDAFEQSSRLSYRTVDDMLRLVSRDSLRTRPGERFRYSNAGYVVLGKIIERVSGQSYFDYVREHIFAPAGMRATTLLSLDQVAPDIATLYDAAYDGTGAKTFENATWWHPVRSNPSGGGYSTAADLDAFVAALHAGRLARPSTVKLLMTAKPALNAPDYGYGFRVDPTRGVVGHGGGAPGVSTNLDIFERSGYVAVVLSNYGSDAREPIVDHIRNLVAAQPSSSARE